MRRRRRWWQVVVRALALSAAVLGVLYATLPYWLPKGLVASKLAEMLTIQLGRTVQIGRLDVSWREGVSIQELTIGNDPAFGGGEMVRLGALRCDFSPLRLWFSQRVEWAEVADARLNVVINDDGQVNLAVLERLKLGYPPERLIVRRGQVTVRLPKHDRLLLLRMADLQYQAGRLRSVGRITMSAVLEQSDSAAPVSMLTWVAAPQAHASVTTPVGTVGGPVIAGSVFRFAKVDIGQMNLPLLLGLPLKSLSGQGSGELRCRVNRSCLVEDFSFRLGIEDLQAEPAAGPALPTVQRAEVQFEAAYDPLYGRADIRKVRLALPGIDLTGEGRMYREVLQGRIEAIRNLQVSGRVNPDTVVRLLSGRMPGGLGVTGDVAVSVSMTGDEQRLNSHVSLDARQADLRMNGRRIKPPDRPLSLQFTGTLEKSTGEFSADQTELRIGDNWFRGSGAMQRIRRLIAQWTAADEPPTIAMLLKQITELDWQGDWEIADAASLLGLFSPRAAETVQLKGKVTGQWFIGPGGLLGLRGVRLPEGTELAVGGWFVKPPGEPMHLELSGLLDPDSASLSRVRLIAAIGDARLNVEDARVSVRGLPPEGPGAPLTFHVEGRYSADDLAVLLACVPPASSPALRLSGNLHGAFRAFLSPPFRRLHVTANATQLDVAAGRAFFKEAGQSAEIVLDFQNDHRLSGAFRNRLTVQADLGSARAQAEAGVCFPSAEGSGSVACTAKASVSDVGWVIERSPAARERLGAWKPKGSLTLSLRAELGEKSLSAGLICDADDLEFIRPDGRGSKPRGSALRVRLAGRIEPGLAGVDALNVDFGRSSVSLSGTVALSRERTLPPAGRFWPPPGVSGVDLAVTARLTQDAAVLALWPELADCVKPWGVEGVLRADLAIRADANELNLAGTLDALGAGVALEGRLKKPVGKKASARFAATVPADLARVHLRDLFVQTDAAELRAGGSFPLLAEEDVDAHAAINVPDLRRLSELLPDLAPYEPAGGILVDAEFRRQAGRQWVKYVTVSARDVAATWLAKPWRLSGKVLVEDLRRTGEGLRVGRASTESLHWTVGKSDGFLVADVRNPLEAPAGEIHLLINSLNAHELGSLGDTTSAPAGGERLTDRQIEALGRRADEIVAAAAKVLAAADLRCRIQADRLIFFDAAIGAFHETRAMVSDLAAKDGIVHAAYRCGVNGGQVEQKYVLDFHQRPVRAHVLGELTELMAGENIQIQLAQEFPGNTFYGTFSRTQDLEYRLRELLMQAMDPRHAPVAVGTAGTITTDGIIRGRAAPKFITRFFPGLNLATYRYQRMTSFGEYSPDGSVHNDMIFEGPNYDVYIEGVTDAQRIGRYEIGAILPRLLESPQSNHRLRQGRVPILKFKARIEQGRFHDEEVWYPLPPETAYVIFVRNNIVYRLLAGGHKQATGKVIVGEPATAPSQPGPSPGPPQGR